MRNAIIVLAAVVGILAAAPASASGFGPNPAIAIPAASVDVGAGIILVRGGCGRGYHRGPRGYCRPNMPPRHHWRRCVERLTPYGWRRFCSVR